MLYTVSHQQRLLGMCRLQCAQAVARSYQALQPQAEVLDQLRIMHSFINSFDADAYVKEQRPVKQLRQDIMLLRRVPSQALLQHSLTHIYLYNNKSQTHSCVMPANLHQFMQMWFVSNGVLLVWGAGAAVIEPGSTGKLYADTVLHDIALGRHTVMRPAEQLTAWQHPLSSDSSW